MMVKKPEPKMAETQAADLVNAFPRERKPAPRQTVNEIPAVAPEERPARPSFLDKWKSAPAKSEEKPVEKTPQPSREAVENAEAQLEALERKDKEERDKMHDGDVIKLR